MSQLAAAVSVRGLGTRGRPFASLHGALLAFACVLAVVLALEAGSHDARPAPTDLAASSGSPTLAPASAAAKQDALGAYRKLPLAFVPNRGQSDDHVSYLAQGAGFGFFFADDRVTLSLSKSSGGGSARELVSPPDSLADPFDGANSRRVALEFRFLGASPDARIEAGREAPGTASYLSGERSRAGLATHRELTYRELWPGIDMTFRGQGGKLKYEFHVAPGADPSRIRLAYAGAEGLAVGAGGTLAIDTAIGKLRDTPPISYQRSGGERVPVESNYSLGGGGYGFALPAGYDRSRPLVIDPGLDYSTFLGGASADFGRSVAVDAQGNAYVTGQTQSPDYPTTPGAFDASFNGNTEAFVTKLNATGSALDYSTFLGGTGGDAGVAIAVDGQGNAYVTGSTSSPDFPTTPGAFDTTADPSSDAFVTKLNASGSALDYSTFLGGSANDLGRGIAVDGQGSAYVTGDTRSGDYPTTPGAFDTTYNGDFDAIVTKLNATGSALDYSTYLGGTSQDLADGIAVDGQGSAYLAGYTLGGNFPTTPGAFDTTPNLDDGFVTKLNPTGSALDYSTFLGGSSSDQSNEIAVDGQGNAYVAGATFSADYPTTPGAFDTTLGGSNDAFVTKLNAAGSALDYSTFLGGTTGGDSGFGIALGGDGSAYVAGQTFSADYPTTPGAFDTTYNGGGDVFVTKLDATGSALEYSTFLGGTGFDSAEWGFAVDGQGDAYVAGFTDSADYPTTSGAFDTTYNGGIDAFVTKLETGAGGSPPASVTLTPPDAVNQVGTSHTVTATVRDDAGEPVADVTVRFSVSGSVNTTGTCTTGADGTCSFSYDGPQFPGADLIRGCADSDGDGQIDEGEPCGEATKAWLFPTSTPGHVTGGGHVRNAAGTDEVAFGFNAKNGDGQPKGNCTVVDPAFDTKVKCLTVTSLVQTGTHATFFGRAEVNGVETDYRIDIDDNGEPGRGRDTFRIITGSGYTAGGTLTKGNVQVH